MQLNLYREPDETILRERLTTAINGWLVCSIRFSSNADVEIRSEGFDLK